MTGTFKMAINFNGDIGLWDISSVSMMESFMEGATSFSRCLSYSTFDEDLCDMSRAFFNCPRINYECLAGWDISGTYYSNVSVYGVA